MRRQRKEKAGTTADEEGKLLLMQVCVTGVRRARTLHTAGGVAAGKLPHLRRAVKRDTLGAFFALVLVLAAHLLICVEEKNKGGQQTHYRQDRFEHH